VDTPLTLIGVELAAGTDVENAGDHRIDTILRVSVRHQLYAVRHSDPDRIGPASEGWPTTTAKLTEAGKAAKGFHSMFSGETDLKTAGGCVVTIPYIIQFDFSGNRVNQHLADLWR
jgi:hypothetical protein